MYKRGIVGVVLALATGTASAQSVPGFAEVDRNGDGVLSFSEFQTALPTLAVSDTNGDAMLNQDEVERALPGLQFKTNGFEGGAALVGVAEYGHILKLLRVKGAGG